MIHIPISFAMSIGFVHSSKLAFGMASRLEGVSIVVGSIPTTDKVSRYSLSLRNRLAWRRRALVETAIPVVSPKV